jgi:hypothetical protein
MTLTGGLTRSMLIEMCWWIPRACHSISQDMIAKSLKVTDISNKIDRSEDNFLWNRSNKKSSQVDANDSEEDYRVS